jgi:P-type Mg2+ transporter
MVSSPLVILPKKVLAVDKKAGIRVSPLVIESASLDADAVYAKLSTRATGLTAQEAQARLEEHGPNVLASDQGAGFGGLLWHAVINPLVILLAALATVSFATADARAGIVMVLMILLSVGLKLYQESKADRAAAKLKAMISVAATALRDGVPHEIPVAHLVPGDVIHLAAGDMIPGDVRMIEAKGLFVIQGSLTGESFPVEKVAIEKAAGKAPLELTSIGFLGTSVESGSATAVVIATGHDTYLGGMARSIAEQPAPTAFDRDISSFTWVLIRLMLVMVPLVFVINGLTKGNWTQAFFFAVAVAVGLTPEMLPMIVTVCLSKGAVAMGQKKVIVKHLDAIQSLGAMDVLCADKTGTLTMDKVVLERHCDVALKESGSVLALIYANSYFQTGLKNVLDRAVLAHQEADTQAQAAALTKVDEMPFDFERRIMSVVVRTPEGKDRIISKGAPEAVFPRCAQFELDGNLLPMDQLHTVEMEKEHARLCSDGFRVLAIASKDVEPRGSAPYGKADESDLVLHGYAAFLDPPKETAGAAIEALRGHGVTVKVLTGDNDLVARKVCQQVGLDTQAIVLGGEIDKMDDEQLADAAEKTTVFARVSPAHKQRIIAVLRSRKHVVGFMGDGINDAPALHAADVGISVDTAVDIARAAADMVLLEKSLLVLDEGVLEGRKVFANISKYIRMSASSNFGNMFSVLGASIFLPFLPMLPIQILSNNLLYDIGQTAVPTDAVDLEQIQKPYPWDIKALLRFIVLIGPCSSIFDYTTFLAMLYVFGCWDVLTPAAAVHSASVFQTGWFVESLLTQTLIIHIIRTNKVPFIQSRASAAVSLTGLVVVAIGIAIPFSPLGPYLGFSGLPTLYWPLLAATIACYVLLTQGVKMWLLSHRWI